MDSNVSKYLKYKQKYLEQKAGMVMYGRPPRRPIHITITDDKNCDDISVTEISPELKKLLDAPDSGNPTDDTPSPEVPRNKLAPTQVPGDKFAPDSGNPTDDTALPEVPEDEVLILNTETKEHFLVPREEFFYVYYKHFDDDYYKDFDYYNAFNFEKEPDGIIKVTDSLYEKIRTYLLENFFMYKSNRFTI